MNFIKNIISKEVVKVAAPVVLGVTGVTLGSVGLSKYDSFPSLLKDQFKKLDLKGASPEELKEGIKQLQEAYFSTQEQLSKDFTSLRSSIIKGNSEWQEINNQLIEKYLTELTEIKTLLTAQKEAILETKNINVDLSPIIKKLDDMTKTFDFDFVNGFKEALAEIKTLLTAQKTPVLSTVKNGPVKDYGKEFKQLEEVLKALDLKIQNVKGQQSEHSDQLKELKNMNLLRDEKTPVLGAKNFDMDLSDVHNKLDSITEGIKDFLEEKRVDNSDIQLLIEENAEKLDSLKTDFSKGFKRISRHIGSIGKDIKGLKTDLIDCEKEFVQLVNDEPLIESHLVETIEEPNKEVTVSSYIYEESQDTKEEISTYNYAIDIEEQNKEVVLSSYLYEENQDTKKEANKYNFVIDTEEAATVPTVITSTHSNIVDFELNTFNNLIEFDVTTESNLVNLEIVAETPEIIEDIVQPEVIVGNGFLDGIAVESYTTIKE